jgi:hypothetical protein
MNTVAFDTLKFSKRLEEAGLTSAQAAGSAAAFAEASGELVAQLATKQDLTSLRHEPKGDIAQLELRMTIKLGSMMAASIALTAALVTLL